MSPNTASLAVAFLSHESKLTKSDGSSLALFTVVCCGEYKALIAESFLGYWGS